MLMLALVVSPTMLSAQKGKLKKANKLYEAFSYPEAAEIYKGIVEKKGTPEAIIKLAECYRLMNEPAEAEQWYARVVELDESEDIHYLNYGMALKMNDKCDEAREVFLEYANRVPADTRGMRLVESCDMEDYFKQDPNIYILKIADINSGESDFGPAFFDEGIVFSSARGGKFEERIYNWTNAPYLDLFYSEREADEVDKPWKLKRAKLFKGKANTWLHEGTVTFSKDQETMFFTRNNYIKGKKGKDSDNTIRLKVYTAQKKGDKWGDIVELPFNSDEYSVGHPTLSADGETLYFVSDMPGGYGEEDIYMSINEGDGEWSEPENLGPEINTEGREMFPFVHEDGTLYFSSDALPGLGGLDVFETRMVDGSWTKPANLRIPINSYYDDFGFILNAERTEGYLASNREGGDGDDDIYAFTKTAFMLEGLIVDCNTEEPIEAALVELYEDGELNQQIITYSDGKFSFPILKDTDYTAKVTKAKYEEVEQIFTTREMESNKMELVIPICPDESLTGNIDGGTGTDGTGTDGTIKCVLRGQVYDSTNKTPIEGATVRLTNRETKYVQTTTTDADGYYYFDLVPDQDFTIMAVKTYYFTKTKEFSTRGIDCTEPSEKDIPLDLEMTKIDIEEVVPEEVLALNHIYYDLDKDFIRDDAAIELDKVVKLMYDNPGILVELGSHTDSRASDAYNMDLSQRRAQSAVDYIVGRGIASDRITAKGYGESQLTNGCSNGVRCTEGEHQANRRTEFKVVGYRANAIYSVPRYFGNDNYYYTPTTKLSTPSTINTYEEPSTFDNSNDSSDATETEEVKSYTYDAAGNLIEEVDYVTLEESSSSDDEATIFDTNFDNADTNVDDGFNMYGFSGDIDYKIQLGSFKNSASLSSYENKLSDLGEISIEQSNGLNRIVLGAYYERAQAEEILTDVRNRGFGDAFLVVYQNGQRMTK